MQEVNSYLVQIYLIAYVLHMCQINIAFVSSQYLEAERSLDSNAWLRVCVCVWCSLSGGRGVNMQQASIGKGPALGVGHLGQGLSHLLSPPHHICLPLQPVYALQQLCLLHNTSSLDTVPVGGVQVGVRGLGARGEGFSACTCLVDHAIGGACLCLCKQLSWQESCM